MSVAHSTVRFPAVTPSIPEGFREASCYACHAALVVPVDAEGLQQCRACQRSQQDGEAGRIASAVRDLAAGEAPMFNLLSKDDIRVHLSQIATAVAYARVKLAESDEQVDAILAGPVSREAQAIALHHYVSMGDEPSEEEKQAIYAMEEIIDREDTLAREQNAGWL